MAAVGEDGSLNPDTLAEVSSNLDFGAMGYDLNLMLAVVMLMFITALGALWLFLRLFHKRDIKSLITPLARVNWSKVFFSFFLWLGFTFILEMVSYMMEPESYTLQFQGGKFFVLVLLCLTLLPLQTSFEELFFRGYLMQGFGLMARSKVVPILITSVLFGLMHGMNPEIEQFGFGIMMTYYITVGFFLGVITLMDDGLELALGVHAATNFFSATFATYDGAALQTYAIFKTEVVDVALMLPVFLGCAGLFIFICWKKYNWPGWQRAFGQIEPYTPEPEPLPWEETGVLDDTTFPTDEDRV